MSKKADTLDSLHAILSGEAIAVHTYDVFIPEVEDPELKITFQKIRSGHRRHLDLLTRRIEELGHRPRIQYNLQMKIGQLMIDARTRVGIAPNKMLHWALKGEDMGLNAVQEITTGTLDEVSEELVSQIMIEDAEYINELMDLIH